MPQPVANAVAWIVESYLGIGPDFGARLVSGGVSRSNCRMRMTPIRVRLSQSPGAMPLWPDCLARVIARSSPV